MRILDGLNPRQREAVIHTEGPLLALAGAGSGKTRVLTCKVAYLVREKGVPPGAILALTFTNKAAREMKMRLENLLQPGYVPHWVSTFHSACVRILRTEIENLGYGRNFVIYDDADQRTLLRNCLRECNFDEKKFAPQALAAKIGRAKNNLQDPRKFKQSAENYFEEQTARVYELYQERLQKQNALDFDDLLMQTVKLFQEQDKVLQRYQRKFRYILVDEYQDTNHAQYVIVKMLADEHRNLCVVGDDDQSIYGWRGADIRNILDFERDYPEAKVIRLEQNYRSTQVILDAANAVIGQNSGRKPKKLWTESSGGELVGCCCAYNEREEAFKVASQIKELVITEGRSYADFAVFYRTHAQSRVLEDVFLREGIPYEIVGGMKFYERREIKDLLAYLRVIINPADDTSLERIINVPRRGIGERTLGKIAEQASARELSLLAVLEEGDFSGISARAVNKLKEFVEMVTGWREAACQLNMTELTKKILGESGYWEQLKTEATFEAQVRMENLEEFLSVTQEYDRENEEASLNGFLEEISLQTNLDSLKEEGQQVVLMTLHTAKGLEFPVVFLVGMEEGVFPLMRALDAPEELEEERRLCYVGMTRAEKRLFLTWAQQRTLYGKTVSNLPSRFLKEIPQDLCKMFVSAQ